MVEQLPAADAAWRRRTGVVVVGSGAAGLSAALHLAAAEVPTILLTRSGLTDGATVLAQGGLAAVWSAEDSLAEHVHDTLVAGAGLCEPAAVRELVEGAPAAIGRLISLGAGFDTNAEGRFDLHLEGGHQRRRILHAGGDASGAEVEHTLVRALLRATGAGSSVEVTEGMRAVDVLLDRRGSACGVRVRQEDGAMGEILAPAVVLATGGVGQLWPLTTNPSVATGDGLAMAYRAGAALRDVEFVQFHPTLLWTDPAVRIPGKRSALVSEAVRGEGAVLVDHAGERVMAGVHTLADLAPRDVVSAAMAAHMLRTGESHLFLDARHFGSAAWAATFPTILTMCREAGVDPVTERIPVHPGAHYLCGGVRADLAGRTTVPGLYAVGEVAATGVQGANRLASNSVTEGLVAGDRVGALLAARLGGATPPPLPQVARPAARLADPAARDRLRRLMGAGVGVVRTAEGLTSALDGLAALPDTTAVLDDAVLDMTNLRTVGQLIASAALTRTESRGAHRRADHPEAVAAWRRHVSLTIGPDAAPAVSSHPMGVAGASSPTLELLEAIA